MGIVMHHRPTTEGWFTDKSCGDMVQGHPERRIAFLHVGSFPIFLLRFMRAIGDWILCEKLNFVLLQGY